MMSSWIKPCTPGLFNKDLLGHRFRSTSSRESDIFLYAVKHRNGRSRIQSVNWLARKVWNTARHQEHRHLRRETFSSRRTCRTISTETAQSDRGEESDLRINLQCRRDWTFVEVFTAKNSSFLSLLFPRKICSRIQTSKGSFNCAGLYKCYWNSQTKTRSYWEICEAEML